MAGQRSDDVRRAAHTLKSTMAHLGARNACDLASELETMGREQQLTHAQLRLDDLDVEMERVLAALAAYAP